MMLDPAQIVRSAQMWVCDSCGCHDNKSCSCDSTAHAEELAAKREAHRQANRRSHEKAKQKQRASDNPADVEISQEFREEADASYQQTLYDHACQSVDEEMSGETRQRFFAHLKERYNGNYAQSPSQRGDKGLPA
jgi:hypothetical protein